jgi:NitT/TauT family transport system substrate-binding protein
MIKPGVSRRQLVVGSAAFAGATFVRTRRARTATKVRFLTNWFAEAEHGGFYQALAAGIYEKAGLDVEIRQGNAQLNGMQLLLAGETDVVMAYDISILGAVEKGAPIKAFFTTFQFDLIGLMTRPDVNSLADLKGRKIYFGANGYSSYWPWLKQHFGYTDDMAAPKGPNIELFLQIQVQRWRGI